MLNKTKKDEILKAGKNVFSKYENTEKIKCSRYAFAEDASKADPAYILAARRLMPGFDEPMNVIEIIDDDNKIMRRWVLGSDMKKCCTNPNLYEDDCLLIYLRDTYNIPIERGYGYHITPDMIF